MRLKENLGQPQGDTELLALALGVSVTRAAELIKKNGIESFYTHPRILAAIELHKRASISLCIGSGTRMSKPEVAGAWATRQIGNLDHEEMWILVVNSRHSLLATQKLSQGGSHGCAILTKDVLRAALQPRASGFILAHNHPNEDPTPSREDVMMTLGVKRAAEVVGLVLLDHIVVSGEKWVSITCSTRVL